MCGLPLSGQNDTNLALHRCIRKSGDEVFSLSWYRITRRRTIKPTHARVPRVLTSAGNSAGIDISLKIVADYFGK